MAFKKAKESTDYGALVGELKKDGPQRLYMLWGEEDYLRESFFEELKKLCVSDGGDFNYHRINGESMDFTALAQAVDSVPFMGERTFTEIRNFPVNDCKDDRAERFKDIVSDIPDYATVVIILPTGYEPDGRLAGVKLIKKLGRAIEFTTQSQSLLIGWMRRRFEAMGKTIQRQECERLMFISGQHMTGLVPEIEKIGSFARGESITAQDIDRLAQHIPEAKVFEMTDALANRRYDKAAELMAELLKSGEHPIKTLAMIGFQMRRLYTARVAIDSGRGRSFLMDTHGISNAYAADKLMECAARFTTDELKDAVELCAESDYLMKSSSRNDEDILKELLLRFAAGGAV